MISLAESICQRCDTGDFSTVKIRPPLLLYPTDSKTWFTFCSNTSFLSINLNKMTTQVMVTLKVSEEDYMNVLIPENVVVALFLKPVGLKPMQKKSPEVRICCFDTCNKECKTGHTLPNSIAFCKNGVSKTRRPCRVESSHDSTLLLFLSHWS